MWERVQVITPPTDAPFTAVEMRGRLRIDSDAEDGLLDALIASAVSMIDGPEAHGLAIMRQTWRLTLDAFAPQIILPGPRPSSIVSIDYMDADGVWQGLSSGVYRLINDVDPARLVPNVGQSWPTVANEPAVIRINYQVGAATTAAADPGLKAAVSLLVGHFYENREATVMGAAPEALPLGVEHLLAQRSRISVAG